jgi:hypothetical protein
MVGQGDVGRLLRADKHLLSQTQYSMLGFRLYVLLKGISEIALRPIQLVAAEVTGTEQHSLLEQEYGFALMGQMLDLAQGFYKGTQGLEGRGNHNAMLLVEFFWWLQWQADYLLRADMMGIGTRLSYVGQGLISFRDILDVADTWSGQYLYKHLAWALMQCEGRGYLSLENVFHAPRTATITSARYLTRREEANMFNGAARETFVHDTDRELHEGLARARARVHGPAHLGNDAEPDGLPPLVASPPDSSSVPALKSSRDSVAAEELEPVGGEKITTTARSAGRVQDNTARTNFTIVLG